MVNKVNLQTDVNSKSISRVRNLRMVRLIPMRRIKGPLEKR